MSFKQAVQQTEVYGQTANGAATLVSSLDPVVDLFFAIGASRGKDITSAFARAYGADRGLTLRCLAYARDIRGGLGERDTFKNLLSFLETNYPNDAELLIPFVPVYGRWDDLFVFKTDRLKHASFALIDRALKDQNQLCAKWMPREGMKHGKIANELREFMGLTPRQYRKLVVGLTNVVETKMCAKDWNSIEFGKLPSLAASRYQKAFSRNAADAYAKYKDALSKGEAKINAGAVYPYDVLKGMHNGDVQVSSAQWEALPNYLGDDKILPMVDVSGSMSCRVGGNDAMTCMDMAIALGLYIADKQQGTFKDMFLTFSEHPSIEVLKGDIIAKQRQMRNAHWGGSTNLEAAFAEVLRVAQNNKVAQADMPKYLLVLSDMEFNAHSAGGTLFQGAKKQFEAAGYELPNIIWWNLNAREGNVPVRMDQNGTALVSGYSPATLRSILSCKTVTPLDIMRETLMTARYDQLGV
jgi:hypothetical protein